MDQAGARGNGRHRQEGRHRRDGGLRAEPGQQREGLRPVQLGPATYRVDSTTSYPTDGNTWVHVAGTYDGTTVRLYYNGVSENPEAASFSLLANAYPLSIGVNGDLTQYFFGGAIDDVRVYNRALSAAEIAALAAGAPVNHAPVASDGTLTTAIDTPADGTLVAPTRTTTRSILARHRRHKGSAVVTNAATGAYTYTPYAGASGSEYLHLQGQRRHGQFELATVNVTITAGGADPSLVGYWTMDETSGTVVHDTGGDSAVNDATTAGAPRFVAAGSAIALSLNGTSQYASAADANNLDLTTAITMAAWIRPGKYETQDIIAEESPQPQMVPALGLDDNKETDDRRGGPRSLQQQRPYR